ncbi:hypothetical protein HK22_11610 [Gluconobacter sp. DsW_056]|uniref:DUF1826 domain-containing protein n=1 Tax=Gluconobacter sp. DsW_056 TaxID=1511209 RepID=UPI000A3C473F|nr:DUF1826 domain-containing protein [Gluconobacter sp. DsW_056]OUI82811.1 hypothetical protein HK22_11610 [Gluconobacter sp. DsW_056]
MSVCPTRRRLERQLPFGGILSAHCSLEMHRMDVSPGLRAAASAYLVTGPRLLMAKGPLSEMAAQLAPHCPEPARLLIPDMLELAEVYSAVSGHRNLRVRLEKITTDSCRKFHVDCVDLRLLRAYVGPGVQWTADEEQTVQEAPTGAVVFLKGKHFPGWDEAEKILHRSPPLSFRPVPERVRLLLTIDEANACGDAAFDMVA